MKILTLVIVCIVTTGCGGPNPANSIDEDIAAIRSNIAGLTSAYKARDWEAFASYFAADGVWMPPDLPQLQGKDAWWGFVSQWWDTTEILDIGVNTEEIIVAGDWAIERHTEYQIISTGEDSEPLRLDFKGVWVFQRNAEGGWKIARYIWNGNTPPVEQ